MEFADSAEPFECKDIKTALTELMEAQKNIHDLKNQLKNASDQLEKAKDDLNNKDVCLFWSFCFNPPQIGSFGTVMFVVGCIISILIVCCCQKWCLSSCPCCIPGNLDPQRSSKILRDSQRSSEILNIFKDPQSSLEIL